MAAVLYLPTLMPGLGTWDTAEFQAIGPVLGVAHPTGYPTYTLLAWLASVVLQPFGDEALRANLLSTLLMAGAAGLVAVRVVQATRRWPLGVLAGLLLAVTPVAWRLSTRADAHALHVFLAALILVLLATWQQRRERDADGAGRWLLAAAVVFGLALGNHALTLLLAPGVAVYVLLVAPRILWREWRLVLACLAALTLTTVAVYAYLPLRSMMDPPLDYGDPQTWDGFWYVVLGQQFQGSHGGLPPLVAIVTDAWDMVVGGLGPLAVLVPAGAALGALRHPRLVALTGLWFVGTWLFALGYPNAAIERYHAIPLMCSAIWAALAGDLVWDALRAVFRRHDSASRVVTASLVAVLFVSVALGVPQRREVADASAETHGRDWLEAALAALPPGSVVMSWWSYSTPLWYGRWVEGRRRDILILDDRDISDAGYGDVGDAIDHHLGSRPVFVIRLAGDLPAVAERFVLERVASVPSPGDLFRVTGRRQAG
jgi:4-amino-4-deoxy-L-arabinose transferase-like glycosyltransferase